MNTKGCLIILLGLTLLLTSASAQSLKSIEKEAKELFKYEDYRDALPLYKKLLDAQPENPEYLTRYGICCLASDNKRDAIPFLLRARDKEYNKDRINYYLGRAFHLNHDFEQAIAYFDLYKKELNPVKDITKIASVNKEIQACLYGMELIKAPVPVKIENLGPEVNSPYPEFVPIVSGDERILFFTSRRPNTTGGGIETATQHFYEDIYFTEKNGNGTWSEPTSFQHNTAGHDACVSLSPGGDKLFLYRHENNGDFYVSTLKGSSWSVPVRLEDGINTKYSETSLAVSPDGKILFFSSDRPGGYGGLDLYYSVWEGGRWSLPVNAGSTINTPENEDAPFIHADGTTLYFSSQGHNSMGGYDIFSSQFDIRKNYFSAPVNIGYPINTADDDIFFVWSPDGTRAYFSSFREDGFGEKDLYMLTRETPKVSMMVLRGQVYSEMNEVPLGAKIIVLDRETGEVVQQFESNSLSGRYLALLHPGKKYRIVVEQPGYVPFFENFEMDETGTFFEHEKDFRLKRLNMGIIASVQNNFYEAGLRKGQLDALEKVFKFMQDNPDLYFEIAGHTDSIGSDEVNYRLSDKRAEEVVSYLTANGVDRERLFPVGYGKEHYIADNDTEEGRMQNCRTEIIIIKKPASGIYNRRLGFYNKEN